MCTTYIYTYVHPDGRREQKRRPALCNAARYGQVCVDNVVLQHPPQYVSSPFSSSLPTPYTGHFPPPPPNYTPRSSTPNYRSGDDSDRSYHSSSSSRRRSGVYINGQRVVDLNRRDRDRHSSRRERIVLVDNPPTPRTPPQTFTFPHTAPSSPNVGASLPYIVDASPRESSSRRPVIVDERPRADRPRVQIEVVDASRRSSKKQHNRHSSTSSHDSRPSYTNAEEEEFRQRRAEREAIRQERRMRDAQAKEAREKEAREKEARELRIRQRIAEANAEINSRPPVPMPPMPRRASTFVAAKAAREVRDREAELIDAVRRLDIEEKRHGEKRFERDEDEAQRARLRERMVPRRRASVGPGSRRHRVLYDDGVYRWE